jgi:hypothetical protein
MSVPARSRPLSAASARLALPIRIHPALVVGLIAALTVILGGAQLLSGSDLAEQMKAKGYRRSGIVQYSVAHGATTAGASAGAVTSTGFTTQIKLGHSSGDGWEPAVAADRFGHVYMLYAQYLGVPGCPACKSPTQVVQVSNDRGVTWGEPTVLQQNMEQGWDSQIVIDPVDGRTVYAAWIERYKSDVIVAKSSDFGATWSYATANMINKGADKDIIAVRGQDVYVAYNHSTQMYVASSHNGGKTYKEVRINPNGKLGWALASAGTVTPDGAVYFSWAGYEQNGVAKGPVNLFISKSTDGGTTWTHKVLDVSGAPPDCSSDFCGWAYLGAQVVMTSGSNGVLYALWNGGALENGPERIWFSKSTNAGASWSPKVEVSTARAGAHHAFPAIAARGSGDVRISWMDTRVNADDSLWNTYYRSSSNGGSRWSAEKDVSTFVPGVSYIKPDGFEYPFGDYYEIDIDDQGTTQVVNGQALNYDTPGHIWYTQGN